MERVLTKKVIEQKVNGISMENYLADALERFENEELENCKLGIIVKTYRQLNSRHRNIIDAYRVERAIEKQRTA